MCNINCNYCNRVYDCVHESRPGVCSSVFSPLEAISRARQVLAKHPNIHTIGIAGPGDPLANPETFATIKKIRQEFSTVNICLSTNGLALTRYIDQLARYRVTTLTVTVNAIDPDIVRCITERINIGKNTFEGRKAAEILVQHQLDGIALAVALGIIVKVNSVLIPGTNDAHLPRVAQIAGELGAYMQNILPLIPQSKFAHIKPPTKNDVADARSQCSPFIRQMTHCRSCRADAVGMLGKCA